MSHDPLYHMFPKELPREQARAYSSMGMFDDVFTRLQIDGKITRGQFFKFFSLNKKQARMYKDPDMPEDTFNTMFNQLQDFEMNITWEQFFQHFRPDDIASASDDERPEEEIVENTPPEELESLEAQHKKRPAQIAGFALGFNPFTAKPRTVNEYNIAGMSDPDASRMSIEWEDTIYEKGAARKIHETNVDWVKRLIQINKKTSPFVAFDTGSMRQFVHDLGFLDEFDDYINNHKPPLVFVNPIDGEKAIHGFLTQILNQTLRL